MFQLFKQGNATLKLKDWLIQFTHFLLSVDKRKSNDIIEVLWNYSTDSNIYAPLPEEYFLRYGEDLLRPLIYILSFNWSGYASAEGIVSGVLRIIKIRNPEPFSKMSKEGLHKDFLELAYRLYVAQGHDEKYALKETQDCDSYGRHLANLIGNGSGRSL